MNEQDPLVTLGGRAARPVVLNILAIGATRPLLQHLIPVFEATTGHSVKAWFGPPAPIEEKLASGEPIDVVFTFEPKWSDMIRAGMIEPGDPIAKVGIGVAVQKGAAKPDLSNEASVRAFLLGARSIAGAGFSDGSVGSWVLRSFQRMGIADAVLPKYRPYRLGTEMIEAVGRREADAVLSVMPDLADSTIVDYAGPFPPDVQEYEIARAAVTTRSPYKLIGRQLIAFVRHPGDAEIWRDKWLFPLN